MCCLEVTKIYLLLFHNFSGLFIDSELDFLLIRTVSIRIVAIPTVLACLLRYNINYVEESSFIATNNHDFYSSGAE